MKSGETVSECLSKTIVVVSQMQTYEANIPDRSVVEKILRILNLKYDHVVAAIEKLKDLFVFSFDELMGLLQAHGVRINITHEK